MLNIYQNIYDIIVQYIFGGVELTNNMELITILLASIGSIFVFVLPFVIVYKIICIIVGGCR